MNRVTGSFVLLLLTAFLTADSGFITRTVAAATDAHEYFNTLVKDPDHWKSYSLRSHAQMVEHRHSGGRPMYVTYDPANDTYPRRQDAAKVTVPEFDPEVFGQLAQPLAAGDTRVVLTATNAQMTARLANRRSLRIGGEVVTIVRGPGEGITDQSVRVTRGQHGTSPQAHALGTSAYVSSNILINQLRLPIGTQDGSSYLFTWDAWYGPEFDFDNTGIGNYKTFLFGAPLYFFQVDTNFMDAPGSDIGLIGARGNRSGRTWSEAYGPNVVSETPVAPQSGSFNIRPGTWTRYWVHIEQNASGYDPLTMWIADEDRDAVKVFDRLQFNVPGTIERFTLEFNTSANELLPRGTLVAYVRNFVALRNPNDPTRILQRPGAGTPLPPIDDDRPGAPRNLRIVR
jgi:hypothetical protein